MGCLERKNAVEGAGVDQNRVQVGFVLCVGIPAGVFTVIVVPAVNEIIAVRATIQLPALAGIAKGDGGTVCVVDVVTRKPCVIVVQLYIVREGCGAQVLDTTALGSEVDIAFRIKPERNLIECVVALYDTSTQIQSRLWTVGNTDTGVFFYLKVCAAFHSQICTGIIKNAEQSILTYRDVCIAGNDKLVTGIIGNAGKAVAIRNNSAFDFQLIRIVDTRECVAAGGDCCTGFNDYVAVPPIRRIEKDIQTDVTVAIAVKFRTLLDHATATNHNAVAAVVAGIQGGTSVHV